MTVVVTVAMLVSGVPTRVIAEGLQEAGVIAAQDSTDQSASSSGQQETAQSNTQEQPQAASEQAAQPSSQDNAAAAQNDSPSAQPAPSAQPSQQTETADIALTLNNASITYKGQVVAQPAQKVTAPTSDSFEFTVQPDNGYKLSKVTLTVSGADRELKADANGLYTVDAADVAQSPRVTLETEQEKAAEPAKEATPIEDTEGVSDDNAAADQAENKKSDEKDVNAVDVAAPADAKEEKYTVEVGGTVPIDGSSSFFNTWESDNESIATVDDAGNVTGVGVDTTTIKHTFGLIPRSTETFTVQVTPAQPKISGADTVKKGDSTTFTVSGFEQGQTVQWMSADSNIATVDANGQVTGVHVGKTNITAYTTNKQSVSKQIEVKRDDSHGGYYVYLYTKAEGDTDGLALEVNSRGWYTIGRVWVKDIAQPWGRSGYATSGTNYDKTIEALRDSDNIDLYGVNSIDIKDIDWAKFGLKTDNGANDYVYPGEWTWHLDGYVKLDNSGSLVFHYKDVDTDDPVREDYTTTAKVTGENFDFSSLRFSIDGYTYDHAEPESVKVEKKQTKYVTLYYRKGTYPYTVKYLEAGTNKVLSKEKKGGGKYGSEVTEKARDIDGYELADSTKQQQSIHLGTGDNVITFYYKKAPAASYTVNYYWNGTKEKVAKSKTVSTGYVGKKVEEAPDDNVKDCTPVSDASKTIKLVKDENENVINFYYYKNVELTAKSDTVTYNGKKQSVSGFTGAPKDADFSEIKVGASGTNAGTYPASFAGGTVGKVDATGKYVVTGVTSGELVINPVTKQVVITITGHNGGEKYNGEEQSVSGFDVSGLPEGLTKDDIACDGKAEAKGKDAGTYPMNLEASQFSLTGDAANNFTNVTFEVTDGKLTINKRDVTIKPKDATKVYNGKKLVATDWEVAKGSLDFVKDQGIANPKYTGSQTKPGSSKSGISRWGYKDNTKADNYNIKTANGTLTVTSRGATQTITVEANSTDAIYDGTEHSAKGLKSTTFTVDGETYTVSGLTTDDPVKTDAGTYTNNITGTAKVTDADGNDVTSEFKVETKNGALNIAKATVTIAPKDASKPYDGSPLAASEFTATGFVGNDGVTNVVYEGSQTDAGESTSSIVSYEPAEGTNLNNYNITKGTGTLTVTATDAAIIVKIKGNTDTQKYSGNAQSVSGYTVVGVTVDGKDFKLYGAEAGTDFTFSGNATATRTDAGTTNMGLAADQFNNINKNFSNVTFEVEDGSMTITKREVTLTSANDKKPYDGTALTNSKVTVSGDGFVSGQGFKANVTGSQTNAGSSLNTFTYELTGVTKDENDNYDITVAPGTLTVNPITDLVTVTIVGNHESGTYNGEELKAEGYAFTSDNKLYTQDKVNFSGTAEAARTYAGKTEMGLNGKFANADTTNFKNVKFEVTDGYVDIAKAPVTLKSRDLIKPYDGTPLTNGETALETETGFAEGEGATYTFTGSQTLVGSSANAFSYTLKPNTKEGNYKITKAEGTLTVTNREAKYKIAVKAKSNTATYNGEPHSAKGLKQDEFTVEGNKYTVSGLTTEDPTKTDAGTYTNNITGTAVVEDAEGNDVTGQFEVTTENGSLVIDKATVTMKSASDEWTYDGNEHTKHDMEFVNGFVDGEGATISYIGAITNAGETKNTFTYKLNEGTNPDNYTIADPEYGTLKVKPVSDKVTVTITGKKDTKPYNGEEQSVTGYDFSADNDLYTQNCVGFTGEATAKGTAVGTYDMELKSTDFSNNNQNFSKVTFVIVDGRLTITSKSIETGEGMTVEKPADVPYNGKVQKQKPVVKDGDNTLVEDTDYILSYSEDATNVGTVKVTVTGVGNYSGKAEVTYQITKRSVVLTSETASKPYDGTPLTKPVVTVAGDGFVEGEVTSIRAAGSVTTVAEGKVTNAIEFDTSKTFKPTNYDITKNEGKLSITELSAENGLTIKPNSVDYPYDATKHAAAAATANASVSGTKVNLEYRVKGTTDDNWTSDPATITAVNAGETVIEVRASAANYSGYKYAEQTLTINKRTVELESASATKVYDGTPLVNDRVAVSREGFIKSDLAEDVHATGTQTKVGASDNTISYKLKEGVADNYNILPEKLGTLTVTAQSIVPDPENPDGYKGVTISDPSSSVYNGEVHKWVPEVKDAKGVALTEGTDYTVSYDTDNFIDAKKITVTIAGTGNYCGSVTKTYRITKAPLTVNAKSASKVYDGNELTAGGTIEGLVGDETATAKTEGSQTKVGSSDNKFVGIEWDGTAKENNYYIQSQNDGVLTVTAKGVAALEVGTLADVVYSGIDQAQKPEVKDGNKALKEGTDYKVSFSKDVKNVGTVTVTVTGKGNYAGSVERTYQITPATLTVTTPSTSKVYNGKALTAEGTVSGFVNGETAAFATTGSQTEVGSSTNTYAIDWGAKESTAKKSNYSVKENLGTLTVTEFAGEVVAAAGNYKGVYDGQAHGVDVTVTGLPEGYTVKSAVSNATATDATEDKVKAEVDDLVIVNADGEDVTSELKITKKTGAIEITPAPLKVTTYGAKAEYNGQALTAGGKVTGFVNNEAASFTATGSQTEVGKSKNTYKIDFNDTAKESNYTVEEDLGTLEVTKNMAAVMVIPNGGSKVYDGKVLESDGVTTYGLPSGYTLEAKTKGSVTNVGSATAEVESYTIKNAAGKDVTDQFGNVATGKATLEVSKRPVTVTSATDSKVYDGSALTKHEASVTAGSLAKGEIFTYDFTGEQTVVGSTANSFTVKAGENTNLDNYKISKADGTLTVTAKSIVPDPSDEHNKMSVDAPASVKYDGNAHKWIPTVKDGDKTLKEGADYTVSYSKDDFTNVTGVITVTITGKGNYAGTVTRTYEITKRSVKLTGVKNVTKVYDGTALEAKDVTVTGDGFVKDEVTDIKATGSVTEVTAKPVENPIEFTAGKGFKEGNYTIEKDPGTLQVTARSIDDATYGMSVSKPESVEYDGQAHKWAPTVKDGEKTLAEGTDYTVAYGKDDFTNVTGEIKVTVTGKGNYAGSVERAYQITPAPLTVETKGATKVYDGEALTHDVATIKGLKNKETATIHATGSQTEVGESDNGYAITWDGSAQKDNYTIKTKTIGKLVVSETADQITATLVNVETTYDGSAHGTTVQVTGLPKGYTVKKAESKATATDVADGEVKATVDELVIVNAQGKDVTSKLNIKRGTATIKINPAPLTVTTDGGEKEYDGTALTANGIKVEGLKGKDSVSAKTTGSRTKVGSSNNTYEINWKDTKKSNYKVTDVLGKLKVKPSNKAVTLTSGTASHAYSGHALTSDEIKAEGLPEGFTVKAKMDGAQTDTGSSKNTVKSYKILDAKGNDVTDMFANVTVKTGTLTVSPKKITVETEGATKVYDGEELTNKNGAIHGLVSGEHADVMTNGTQTNVGSSDNGYTIAWGTAKEGNYTIASDTLGKLVVMPQSVNPNDPSYHKLQVSNPADLTYDGQTHKWAPEVKDYTGTELKEGVDYTLAYDTDDFINAGSITVTVVGKGNYTGTVSRTYRIKPAPVSIKTESAARVYNGKALTAGGAITGLVNGETVDFRVIGSQTKVGHSANTYKLAWTGTAREANYTVDSIETGTLTVTESEDTVVVTTTGGTFTYDGKAHGATVAVSQLPEGYTVDGTPSSDATATDANGDGVKATVDHLVIRNAEGEDVTSKLNIKKVDGTIKVLPAELTVTTDSATKVYDGTALTAGATVTGLVGDEEATLEATGKQTQVGSSGNGYKLTFDKTAKDKNYKVVSENLGTLTVTKQSIVPSEPGTPSDNYKGVTVDDPKDAVYDGVEHKWTPVVKDAEGKTLVEGTDYVVSYDTDDFIDVATTNVTITGKGNYAGTIAKSYRITKAPLHVVTGSATKVYDGQALTSVTVTIDGLAKRDRIGVAVTGSQTNVGSSQNTYAIDWMQTSADNYELTDELGTLTVAAAPARPTTPSTPVTPTTPTTPTVPNPTPNSSDGGSTTTTAAPTGEDSATGNDQEQKEEKIFDAKNPLGKFDGKKDTCWVHWYMIVCAVATAAYGLFVGLRRDKHGRRLQNDLDKVLGNDDETQE